MKKHTKATLSIFIILVVSLTFMCGCTSKTPYVKDKRNDDYSSKESYEKNSENDENNTVSSEKGTPLDPFEGLIVEFDGISPYCTISFNNSRCSEAVQRNVEYSLENNGIHTEEKLAINESVTVYAILRGQDADNPEFYLTSTEKEYKVENVPEYITEVTDDMDLSQLKAEAKDYFDSITAFTTGSSAMGVSSYYSHTLPLLESVYFSALKLNSFNKFNGDYDCFNKINIFYSTTITSKNNFFGSDDGDYNRYFTICAKNIVRYPDGTIGWGKDDPKSLSFDNNVNGDNMESLVNSNITSIKTDYNVTEITNVYNN